MLYCKQYGPNAEGRTKLFISEIISDMRKFVLLSSTKDYTIKIQIINLALESLPPPPEKKIAKKNFESLVENKFNINPRDYIRVPFDQVNLKILG